MPAPFAGKFPSEIQGTVPGAPNFEAFAASPSVAGSFSGSVGVTNFATAADVILYPNERSMIVATASQTTIAGAPATIVTLPDGMVMTLVGVAAGGPVLFAL